MANSSPAEIGVSYDNSGGSPVDITAHVLSINDIDVEEIIEQTNPFGVAWEEHKGVGVGRMPPVELGGLYDDVATTGPDALFANRVPEGPAATTRTLTITWRSGKTTSVETRLVSYRRSPDRTGLTKYTVTLQPTGAVTEA